MVGVAPKPKFCAPVVLAPYPNVGAALVVDAPNPKEETGVLPVVEELKPNEGVVDVVVEPNP